MSEGREILWAPPPERAAGSRLAQYWRWIEAREGQTFADYPALWNWSVENLEPFWASIWDYFDVIADTPYLRILENPVMPGAKWCPGARINYTQNILRHVADRGDEPALICWSETHGRAELNWQQLNAQVASMAARLRGLGVGVGDRVVAVLPNGPEAAVAFLASASLGAIWSLCAPDMGQVAVLDRFRQIEPKVLIYQDGYVHAGKTVDRRDVLETVVAGLPTVEQCIVLPVVGGLPDGAIRFADLIGDDVPFEPVSVEFEHPLWIVYSSGTTGDPKPIVHGHGGILLEANKQALHMDIGDKDRFCWLTSSGWIMWNAQWTALGQGATVAMYDGAPNVPDFSVVWDFIAREQVSYFGAGAAFFGSCAKAGVTPRDAVDLSALRSLGSTGSPLSSDAYDWIYTSVKSDVWLAPISGGTDLAGAFVLGNPMAPVRAGEMQCRALGNAVRAFNDIGDEVVGTVGELVCTKPLPSMPLYFWGDEGNKRLISSYFDTYPGVWRHGDWIEFTPEGGSVIYGRSDATINRKGLRMGSAEIYQAVEGLDMVLDSLIVDLEFLERESFMPLFVVLKDGLALDDSIKAAINSAIRTGVSARFLPNEIVQVDEIPRTLSGKKLEVPVKKLLLGGDAGKVVNLDSMANPQSFEFFVGYAARRTQSV